jgi:HSP20 family molecular chaperone IbpA
MTKFVVNHKVPVIDRDEFLTPFDRMFDQIINTQFPQIEKQVGVKPYQGTAYPKVNVYEYDDKVGVIAEIPGLDKKDLSIDVEDGVLTIAGDKHGLFDDDGAKVIRRELKHSSFKRSFELGELLNGDKVKASFKASVKIS